MRFISKAWLLIKTVWNTGRVPALWVTLSAALSFAEKIKQFAANLAVGDLQNLINQIPSIHWIWGIGLFFAWIIVALSAKILALETPRLEIRFDGSCYHEETV